MSSSLYEFIAENYFSKSNKRLCLKLRFNVIITIINFVHDRVSEASSRPRAERRAPVRNHIDDDSDDDSSPTQSFSPPPVAFPSAPSPASNGPYYSGPFKALYDFESGKKKSAMPVLIIVSVMIQHNEVASKSALNIDQFLAR